MRIGDIFVKFADFMKVYTAYVNNYNDAFKVFMDYTPLPDVAAVRPTIPSLYTPLLIPRRCYRSLAIIRT